MLYIIGGASRSGKSTLSRMLLHEQNIPYFSMDFLLRGLTSAYKETDFYGPPEAIEHIVWPIIEPMLNNIVETERYYCVEGDCITPKQAMQMYNKFPHEVKICFLGFPKISCSQKAEQLFSLQDSVNNWTQFHSKDFVYKYIERNIDYSIFLEKECSKMGIPYFDTSTNFYSVLRSAFNFMFTEPNSL